MIYNNKNIYKKYDPKYKTWDYHIPGWKLKDYKIHSKESILDETYNDWFDDDSLYSKEIINKLKKEYNYKKEFSSNKLKNKLFIKDYALFSALDIIFYYLELEFKDKDIYYIKDNYSYIYTKNPILKRLRNKKTINLPNKIEEITNIQFGIINYWVFKDAVVFKN